MTTAVVVGAGVNGLSAAWNLARLGARRIVLVERFRIGHDRGSSHGASRITRTSYHDARYARLAQAARREDWPRLERDAGTTLVHPAPGLFLGPPDGRIRAYAAAAESAGAPVDALGRAEARRRFPQFAFADDPTVLVDRSAGVVAAAETVAALARLVRAAGVDVRTETVVRAIDPRPDAVHVETDRGTLSADRVVVTAGAWVARLVPSLAARVTVARQTVGYFEPDAGPGGDDGLFRAPRFPVWVWIGREPHDHFYGLPEFGRPGIKAARHATACGAGDDPDETPDGVPSGALEEVAAFLARLLVRPPRGVVGWERCLYTNEPHEEFLVGPLAGDPRVIVGSACSGHAFKFAPLTGRILAELALHGRTTCAEF